MFVDDEPAILAGIRRGLGEMRLEWDVSYYADGREAIAGAAGLPADVIVADLKMPGLNGVEMLNEMRRYGVLADSEGLHRYSALIERAMPKFGDHSVVMFLSDIDRWEPPSLELLKHGFGLTNTEARLARGLASGQEIKEVAASMGITLHTARTYLKAVFEKTDTNRQADLVRILITTALPSL